MAKKKRHKNKKHKQADKVVKTTTNIKEEPIKSKRVEDEKVEIKEVASVDSVKTETSAVTSDVKFSLMLLGIIIIAFIAIFIALTNKSVSNSVYGIIKINL